MRVCVAGTPMSKTIGDCPKLPHAFIINYYFYWFYIVSNLTYTRTAENSACGKGDEQFQTLVYYEIITEQVSKKYIFLFSYFHMIT